MDCGRFLCPVEPHRVWIVADFFVQLEIQQHRAKTPRNLLNTSCHILPEISNCFGDGFLYIILQDFSFILKWKMIYISQSTIAFIAIEFQKVSSDIAHIRSHKSRDIEADLNFRRKKATMSNSKGVKLSLCQYLSMHNIKEKTESWHFLSLFLFVPRVSLSHILKISRKIVFSLSRLAKRFHLDFPLSVSAHCQT